MEKQNVMVCITDQKKCDRLIENAMARIDRESCDVFVVHILKNSVITDSESGEALEYLINLCNRHGAFVSIIKSDVIKEALLKFATEKNISCIIMGETRNTEPNKSVIHELRAELDHGVEIIIVPTK